MATQQCDVVVAADGLDGGLPSVCASSGVTDDVEGVTTVAVTPVGAGWLLLLFGVLPFVVWRALTRRRTSMVLPVASEVRQRILAARAAGRRRALRAGLAGAGLLVGGLVLVALLDGSGTEVGIPLAVVGLAVAARSGWAVAEMRWWTPFGPSVRLLDGAVVLHGVHPHFTAATSGAPDPYQPVDDPSPGWYRDPGGSQRRRWWDGRRWTDSVA